MTDDNNHVLYRFYSATGQLLYVGITMNPAGRFKKHRDTKDWWADVAGISIENYDTREDLANAERRAIQVERPLHNVVHNGRQKLAVATPIHARVDTNCTQKNPLGMVNHDNSMLASLPGWQELTQAINRLAIEAGVQVSPDNFADAVALLARSVGYMDCCEQCEQDQDSEDTSVAPHQVTVFDGSMRGYYRCRKGHVWFCWYTLRQSELA